MFHLLAYVALTAQPSAPPAPPPPPAAAAEPNAAAQQAIGAAAQAWSQCIGAGVGAAPSTGTPEAAASAVMANCRTQQTALETAVNGVLATLPAEQQAAGRQQMQTQIAAVPAQIAAGIQQRRAAAAAPAAPTAPPAPPAPLAPRQR